MGTCHRNRQRATWGSPWCRSHTSAFGGWLSLIGVTPERGAVASSYSPFPPLLGDALLPSFFSSPWNADCVFQAPFPCLQSVGDGRAGGERRQGGSSLPPPCVSAMVHSGCVPLWPLSLSGGPQLRVLSGSGNTPSSLGSFGLGAVRPCGPVSFLHPERVPLKSDTLFRTSADGPPVSCLRPLSP